MLLDQLLICHMTTDNAIISIGDMPGQKVFFVSMQSDLQHCLLLAILIKQSILKSSVGTRYTHFGDGGNFLYMTWVSHLILWVFLSSAIFFTKIAWEI